MCIGCDPSTGSKSPCRDNRCGSRPHAAFRARHGRVSVYAEWVSRSQVRSVWLLRWQLYVIPQYGNGPAERYRAISIPSFPPHLPSSRLLLFKSARRRLAIEPRTFSNNRLSSVRVVNSTLFPTLSPFLRFTPSVTPPANSTRCSYSSLQ